jgi:hypothetical protein
MLVINLFWKVNIFKLIPLFFPPMIFHSVLHNYLIPGAAILLISVLTHVRISACSLSFWILCLTCHLVTKSCSPNTVKTELHCRRKCVPLQLAITIVPEMGVACDNSRPFQPIFSCHRRLVSYQYKRPTVVYVKEDTAVQETFSKYLGVISPYANKKLLSNKLLNYNSKIQT